MPLSSQVLVAHTAALSPRVEKERTSARTCGINFAKSEIGQVPDQIGGFGQSAKVLDTGYLVVEYVDTVSEPPGTDWKGNLVLSETPRLNDDLQKHHRWLKHKTYSSNLKLPQHPDSPHWTSATQHRHVAWRSGDNNLALWGVWKRLQLLKSAASGQTSRQSRSGLVTTITLVKPDARRLVMSFCHGQSVTFTVWAASSQPSST